MTIESGGVLWGLTNSLTVKYALKFTEFEPLNRQKQVTKQVFVEMLLTVIKVYSCSFPLILIDGPSVMGLVFEITA